MASHGKIPSKNGKNSFIEGGKEVGSAIVNRAHGFSLTEP